MKFQLLKTSKNDVFFERGIALFCINNFWLIDFNLHENNQAQLGVTGNINFEWLFLKPLFTFSIAVGSLTFSVCSIFEDKETG